MSGHSKWASIKHKKGAQDAKRGKLFTKLIREITVSARQSGGSPDSNPRLRLAIQRAKDANMPQNNIERALKKGTGELEGTHYEEITYEGYGPGGVAIIIDVLTDNKNRATGEIRNIFSKKGGNMAGQGSVSWIFEKKGYIVVNKDTIEEDKLMSIVLEAGAEDLKTEETAYAVTTEPGDFDKVKKALEDKNVKIEVAEITSVPKNTIKVIGEDAKKVLSLVNELEENDDVQNVYANFDIPDSILKELEGNSG
ncbi:MAG: YebC/PmpR family DNA-binding transcriptional regulator [Candidatus Omnitrophica bacterium]|nr:YebC/PmpR family DNA-binding transcriptional regulator [Candidatus Omnitrophota bacterium]